jgi:hypothetical protein
VVVGDERELSDVSVLRRPAAIPGQQR